jgi:hypothetical protein
LRKERRVRVEGVGDLGSSVREWIEAKTMAEDVRTREKRLSRKATRRVEREVENGLPKDQVEARFKKMLKRYLADPNA